MDNAANEQLCRQRDPSTFRGVQINFWRLGFSSPPPPIDRLAMRSSILLCFVMWISERLEKGGWRNLISGSSLASSLPLHAVGKRGSREVARVQIQKVGYRNPTLEIQRKSSQFYSRPTSPESILFEIILRRNWITS